MSDFSYSPENELEKITHREREGGLSGDNPSRASVDKLVGRGIYKGTIGI